MFDPLDILLPSPRDDEPASLRQDIIDEVRDHLHSALLHELHRTPDEHLAKQTVLQRFGDPAALVRKLWLQALRDKIMTQKILSASALLMAAACLGVVVVMWQMLHQNQKATADLVQQNQQASTALIQQMKDSNTQLLAQFQTVVGKIKSDPAPLNPEWCSLKLRFSLDKSDGPPAKDFRVILKDYSGTGKGEREIPQMSYRVGETGIVNFGSLKFGRYLLVVQSPWDMVLRDFVLTLKPQQNLEGEILCPSAPPPPVPLTADLHFPEKVPGEKFILFCEFTSPPTVVDNRGWAYRQSFVLIDTDDPGVDLLENLLTPNSGSGFFNIMDKIDSQTLQATFSPSLPGGVWRTFITPEGQLFDIPNDLPNMRDFNRSEFLNETGISHNIQRNYLNWPILNDRPPVKSLNWPAGELRLRSITFYTLPHQLYSEGRSTLPDGRKGPWTSDTSIDDLSGAYQVADLPADHPLRQFVAKAGTQNTLKIDVATLPQKWLDDVSQHRLANKMTPLHANLQKYWDAYKAGPQAVEEFKESLSRKNSSEDN